MGDPVVANIMKSGAVLWFAPLGTAFPPITTVGAGEAWPAPWERIGFIASPLTLTYDDTRLDIVPDDLLAPLEDWRTGETALLETELAEATAAYIRLFTGGTVTTTAPGVGTAGYEQLDIGGVARVTKYAVGFEGIRYDEDDEPLPQRCLLARASFKSNGKWEYSKRSDSYLKIPIQVKGFGDASLNGRVIRWQRVTGAAL